MQCIKNALDGAISVLSSLCNRKSRILMNKHIYSLFLKSTAFPNSHKIFTFSNIKLFVVIITVEFSSLTFFLKK